MMKLFFLSLIFASVGCSHNTHWKHKYQLKKAVESEQRSPENKVRDVYRNPLATLEFFEVKPDMHVVEITPGGGWYTEILAPYLAKEGKLTLAIFDDESEVAFKKRLNEAIKGKYPQHVFTVFDAPEYAGPIAPEASVDRVLTFRNIHNWMKAGKFEVALETFYKALKPGGILGVVEHRAKTNRPQDPQANNGYVREDYVIAKALAAGFEFVSKSEINANYLDTADHPEGVWTLPPILRLKEKDRAKYLAIGESDRMTLKFRRPLATELD